MARKTQALQLVQDATLERAAASAVSKIAPLLPPWVLLGGEAAAGAVSHTLWSGPGHVAWAAAGCTLCSTLLTGITWAVSHRRRMTGRVHSTVTTAAATGWFTVATITGYDPATSGLLFFGGAALALSWNIRAVIRSGGDGDGAGDALGTLFDRAKEQAGLKGARVRASEVTDHKVKGQMQLPPGEQTAEDAQKAAGRVESGMQLPPGSVTIARDEDRADRAHITVSDPRVIRRPLPWPGPSRPGGSIADPLRIGVYQSGDPVLYRLPGQHLQIMGMTGSGKSIGGAWNIIGEVITRADAAVFSIDVSKDDQTMGPLRPALHRFETTKAGAVDLIRGLHAEIPARTRYLAARGFQNWEPGCGLTYWVFHLEELAKLFSALDTGDADRLEEILKELRSAGGSVLASLQRADYTQIPTIIRSQMTKMCFGLSDPDDGKYGLSARQRKADVAPHEWENHYPGMAVLDGRGIPASCYAMPLRTYAWGTDSRTANAAMAAHAAQHPASAKPADEYTARLARPATQPHQAPAAAARPAPATAAGHGAPGGDYEREEFLAGFADLLADAAGLVIRGQQASPALLARELRITATDALRLTEALERKDIIGAADPATGTHPVLITPGNGANGLIEQIRQDGDPVTAALTEPDPDPAVSAGPYDAIQAPAPGEADDLTADEDQVPGTDPAAARAIVHDWLRGRHAEGRDTFTASDPELARVRASTGNGRTWIYNVLRDLNATGVLTATRDGGTKAWTITDLTPLNPAT